MGTASSNSETSWLSRSEKWVPPFLLAGHAYVGSPAFGAGGIGGERREGWDAATASCGTVGP